MVIYKVDRRIVDLYQWVLQFIMLIIYEENRRFGDIYQWVLQFCNLNENIGNTRDKG